MVSFLEGVGLLSFLGSRFSEVFGGPFRRIHDGSTSGVAEAEDIGKMEAGLDELGREMR